MNSFRLVKLSLVLLLIVVPVALIASAQEEEGADVHFYLGLIEIKGATSTNSLAAPEINPGTLSAGYGYAAPGEFDANAPDRWQVSSYMFSDSSMVVRQGDEVGLTFFGVNGDLHVVWVVSPSGEIVVEPLEMHRGREYSFEFAAEEAGYYRLICGNDAPSMTATILAIPTG